MLGVTYQMADDHLMLLPADSWVPMLEAFGWRFFADTGATLVVILNALRTVW